MAAGDMVVLAASVGDIDTSEPLQVAEAYGKVFIANGENLKVVDFQNTKITTTDVGAHPPDRGNILVGGTSGANMVVDYITALTGACTIYGYRITKETFTNETVTGTDDDGNAISFTGTAEVAPPHWYDWTVYGNNEDLYGKMPDQAYLIATSGGRLVLSGNRAYPHQCPASAAGNPWDWNPYRTTSDRAVPIGTGQAGAIGDIVRALIPMRDGQLVIGCANSMHAVIDNPAYGGQIIAMDRAIGIFDGTSWCQDRDGNLYFFGAGGVHKIARGSLVVESISAGPLPNLVADEGADPTTHRITMGYDPVRVGIKLSIVLLADGSSSNYWIDLQTGGFFPDTFDNAHGAYSMFYYNANDPDDKGLLIGCTDGYIRVHDDAENSDDATVAIDSYVTFGPLPLAEDGKDGSIAAFDMVLAGGATGDCDAVTAEVWTEDVAETVLEDLAAGTSPQLAMTFAGPGRSRGAKRRRGVRGAYAGIKIGNDNLDETWGMEKVLLDSGSAGRRLR